MYGYASSPIAFRDTVIVPVGGTGQGGDGVPAGRRQRRLGAQRFRQCVLVANADRRRTGWSSWSLLMDGAVFAVNPHNGDLQWQVPFKADYGIAVATPVWGPGNLLFVSAEYDAGAKVIQLQRNGLRTKATEVWTSNRLRLHHGNAMRIGDTVYFSSGGKGSQAILTAVDVRSGKIYWQERSIAKATFVWADQKLITLDRDGNLMLAHPSPQGSRSRPRRRC